MLSDDIVDISFSMIVVEAICSSNYFYSFSYFYLHSTLQQID